MVTVDMMVAVDWLTWRLLVIFPCLQQAYEAMSSNQQEQDAELAALADIYQKVTTCVPSNIKACTFFFSRAGQVVVRAGVHPLVRTANPYSYIGCITLCCICTRKTELTVDVDADTGHGFLVDKQYMTHNSKKQDINNKKAKLMFRGPIRNSRVAILKIV